MMKNSDSSCLCVDLYYGEHCEKTCDEQTDCSGNGICLHNGKCLCNEGFKGSHCEEEGSPLSIDVELVVTLLLLILLCVQVYFYYKQTVWFIYFVLSCRENLGLPRNCKPW